MRHGEPTMTLHWRHNDHGGISNNQPHECLLNRLFRRRSKKTSKLRLTGLCAGNSLGTGELPAQRASYTENVSILWRHHETELTQDSQYMADPCDMRSNSQLLHCVQFAVLYRIYTVTFGTHFYYSTFQVINGQRTPSPNWLFYGKFCTLMG